MLASTKTRQQKLPKVREKERRPWRRSSPKKKKH